MTSPANKRPLTEAESEDTDVETAMLTESEAESV